MEFVFYLILYLGIGIALDYSLSDEPTIWAVILWPLLVTMCFILLIVQIIERKRK